MTCLEMLDIYHHKVFIRYFTCIGVIILVIAGAGLTPTAFTFVTQLSVGPDMIKLK